MGADRGRQIFNIIGENVLAPSKSGQGLSGPHQPQCGARAGTELYGLVIARRVDDIGNVFSDRLRNTDVPAGFLKFSVYFLYVAEKGSIKWR